MVEKEGYKLEKPREYYWHPPKCLEDIDVSDIKDEGPLDESIKMLVRALRGLGLITMGSCEGHLDASHHRYPWVTVFGLWRYEELYPIIEAYNETSKVKWVIDGTALVPSTVASDEIELKELQEDSQGLARFLFDNYISVPTRGTNEI